MNEREIFDAAAGLVDEAERSAYLQHACADDAALRKHVERMLLVYPKLGNFLESPAIELDGRSSAPRTAGRFELGKELARGGMGIVYSARDELLGRDVAVKVLHKRYGIDSVVAFRFMDEARITAQLQHPGIPPVFEVGRLNDARPYLAMKLIEGRTLQELLNDCPDPTDKRGQFLSIFEQICHAVGYAHSRSVMHRDLKPANIMVGAFGEVQVMDWGLAKLVTPADATALVSTSSAETNCGNVRVSDRESGNATLAGSMLGTPAFVPPEQAGGDIDKVDERSDVFGLGAILCVILTGQPPYIGATTAEVRRMAILGMVEDAFGRLDRCGADNTLVELCKRCLTFKREDRPQNAGIVARTVALYTAGVEERARQAQLERAAAEVRAAEGRKRRRVQLALVATLLLMLGLVSFGFWWRDRLEAAAIAERAVRDSRVTAGVSEALREARERVNEAWKLIDFPDRMRNAADSAMASLRRGDELASGGAPDKITRDLFAARTEVDEVVRHTRLLQSIRTHSYQFADESTGQGWSEPVREYTPRIVGYLTEFGLDPINGSVDEIAEAIATSRSRDDLIHAIQGWHFHCGGDRLARIVRLARLKSGGAYARWQELLDSNDVSGLVRFAQSLEEFQLGAKIMQSVYLNLRAANQLTACKTLLRLGTERSPHEVWFHFDLAGICLEMNPPEYAEALHHSSAAVLLRPSSAAFQLRLGDCYAGLGQYSLAGQCYSKSIELGHGAVVGYLHLADVLAKQEDWEGAIAASREAVQLQPGNYMAVCSLSINFSLAGRNSQGLSELLRAIQEYPDLANDPHSSFKYNAACLMLLLAAGNGVDAPPRSERAIFRQWAFEFLIADLAATRVLASTDIGFVRRHLRHCINDPDLTSIRGPDAIGKLPVEERDSWTSLWKDVDELNQQTTPKTGGAR